MYNHISDYAHLDVESVNADLPKWLRYDSLQDRILSMAEPTTLSGELEVIAATKVIRKRIAVLDTQGHLLQRYGESSYTQELTVQFTSCGQDVGHYNCLIQRPAEDPAQSIPQSSVLPTESQPSCNIRDIIFSFSPHPKVAVSRKRNRKAEASEILTSSPMKSAMEAKRQKQQDQQQNKRTTAANKKGKRKRSVQRKAHQDPMKRTTGPVCTAARTTATQDQTMFGSNAKFARDGPMNFVLMLKAVDILSASTASRTTLNKDTNF